jgi:hypothetical protein
MAGDPMQPEGVMKQHRSRYEMPIVTPGILRSRMLSSKQKVLDVYLRCGPMLRPVAALRRKAGGVKKGEYAMRLSVASSALAAAFVLAPVAAGYAPALSQDFSITNQEPANAGHPDVMRQLQAWWDAHAYYPGTRRTTMRVALSGSIW